MQGCKAQLQQESILAKENITARAADYSQWYLDIVEQAGLSEPSGVRGCMIIKPHGYAIWELIVSALDKRIKDTGHVNAYFPLLIPKSYLMKEADHVEGFAPEVAEVTRGGGKELEEPLVIRPTSETIIGVSFARWVRSWRDLPLLINQWANVMRWEMRTRPFLRTAEFLWQEGHTAHVDEAGAEAETLKILNEVYADMVENVMAVPVFRGRKTAKEAFPGALRTYSIEAMMQDGKALQAGTSHNLGQNFAKAFDIKYSAETGQEEYCWTTSWGVSTRLIGALIMTHSDDDGLVLPPKLAPIQVVIVPILRGSAEDKANVIDACHRLTEGWKDVVRFKIDDRDNEQFGFKVNEWEVKGVPIRIEIGPKDLEKGTAVLARRDRPGKQGKTFVPQEGLLDTIQVQLKEIQKALYDRALAFREEHTFEAETYEDLKAKVENGFVWAYFDGDAADEERIQEETKATVRTIPFEPSMTPGVCIITGRQTSQRVLFARSY